MRQRKFEDHIKIMFLLLTLFPYIFWETLLTRIYLNSWHTKNTANRFLNLHKNFGRLPRHFFRQSVDRTGIVESELRVNVAKSVNISTLLTLFPVIFWETLLTRIYLNSWQSENAANRLLNLYKNFGRLPRHFFRRSVDRTGIVESELRVNVAKNHQLSRYTT